MYIMSMYSAVRIPLVSIALYKLDLLLLLLLLLLICSVLHSKPAPAERLPQSAQFYTANQPQLKDYLSLLNFTQQTVPSTIRLKDYLNLPSRGTA